MTSAYKIEFIPYNQMETILPLVVLLNEGKIAYEVLKKRLANMLSMGGYKCIGVYYGEELIGICGVWELHKLYAGKHLEPDNVFIKMEHRGNGVGTLMMNRLFQYAREIGCDATEVNCYIKNTKGKKFWEQMGYETLGYHLIKKFDTINS